MKLADARDVVDAVKNLEGATLPVLTPNLKVCNVIHIKTDKLYFSLVDV